MAPRSIQGEVPAGSLGGGLTTRHRARSTNSTRTVTPRDLCYQTQLARAGPSGQMEGRIQAAAISAIAKLAIPAFAQLS